MNPSALLAQNSTDSTANSGQTTTQTPDAKKKAAERRQVMGILGINRKDLKGLSEADRHAKIKQALNTKIADFEQKKAAGSLTDKEQSDLSLLKKFEHQGHAKAKSQS